MEEKKVTKISIADVLLIIALIVIVVMGVFMFKLNKDKIVAIGEAQKLNDQVNSLQNKVNDLQRTIDNVSNTINSSKSNEIAKDINCNISITNESVDVIDDSAGFRLLINAVVKKLSYDEQKYSYITLSGYCLGSNNEKYLISNTVIDKESKDFYFSDTGKIIYPDGTVKSYSEIDCKNVKIKSCKIDKMIAFLKDGSSVEMNFNYEKTF